MYLIHFGTFWETAYSDDGVMDYTDENGIAFRPDGVETVFVCKK